VPMARITRKSYVVAREPDRAYAIYVKEDLQPAGTIMGFPSMDRALDECARLNAEEDERRLREEASDAAN
jgi:hypothetical protein